MTRQTHQQFQALAIASVLAVAASLWLGAGVGSARPVAHKKHTISVSENADLHLIKKSGGILHESGVATGTLPGSVTARFDIGNILRPKGSVTFHVRHGTLTLDVVGTPQSLGTVAKFSGSMTLRKGTGRYAHAHGKGTFNGTVNRRTWAMTVHGHAKLTY